MTITQTSRAFDTAPWSYPINPDFRAGNRLANFFVPKNPVTGLRQFNLFPLWCERLLGNVGHHFLHRGERLSFKRWPIDTTKSCQGVVDEILNRLAQHAPTCYGKPWNFKVAVIASSKVNAYALPGGKIYIYEQLIKDICNFCLLENKHLIKKPADCSLPLDFLSLKGIGAEDVLASIIAHEMVHICARHSTRLLTISKIATCILFGLGLLLRFISPQMKKCITVLTQGTPIQTLTQLFFVLISLAGIALYPILPEAIKKIFKGDGDDDDDPLTFGTFWPYIRDALIFIGFYKGIHFAQMKLRRNCEYDADWYGMHYAMRAGYDPRGALMGHVMLEAGEMVPTRFCKGLWELNLSHPHTINRQNRLIREICKKSPELFGLNGAHQILSPQHAAIQSGLGGGNEQLNIQH